ncbi:hypothetical protein, partial [Limnobacter sp. P1]|uniref:hypothetical protein n=1 Tax=Limnobacter olei TaxID=3031298 RepID=UPI0023B087D5
FQPEYADAREPEVAEVSWITSPTIGAPLAFSARGYTPCNLLDTLPDSLNFRSWGHHASRSVFEIGQCER